MEFFAFVGIAVAVFFVATVVAFRMMMFLGVAEL